MKRKLFLFALLLGLALLSLPALADGPPVPICRPGVVCD